MLTSFPIFLWYRSFKCQKCSHPVKHNSKGLFCYTLPEKVVLQPLRSHPEEHFPNFQTILFTIAPFISAVSISPAPFFLSWKLKSFTNLLPFISSVPQQMLPWKILISREIRDKTRFLNTARRQWLRLRFKEASSPPLLVVLISHQSRRENSLPHGAWECWWDIIKCLWKQSGSCGVTRKHRKRIE